MTTAEQYKKFEELDKLASQGGGVDAWKDSTPTVT